jgi:hypothetical protein
MAVKSSRDWLRDASESIDFGLVGGDEFGFGLGYGAEAGVDGRLFAGAENWV